MVDIVVNHNGWNGPPDSVDYSKFNPFNSKDDYNTPYCEIDYNDLGDTVSGPCSNAITLEWTATNLIKGTTDGMLGRRLARSPSRPQDQQSKGPRWLQHVDPESHVKLLHRWLET